MKDSLATSSGVGVWLNAIVWPDATSVRPSTARGEAMPVNMIHQMSPGCMSEIFDRVG